MDNPIVFMFPGQGAQYFQMGRELYDNNPRFRLWMNHCDELVFNQLKCSLIEIIYQKEKSEPFDKLKYSNPALLSIEYSLARVLIEGGIKPDFLLGYSLGEISASVLSGALPIETALVFSIELAELIENKSPDARMLAIQAPESIREEFSAAFSGCWPIAHNLTNHFVVCGLTDNIQTLNAVLYTNNIVCQLLPVNYGFHTPLLDPLMTDVLDLARRINFAPVRTPMMSSFLNCEIDSIDERFIWELLRYPVNFRQSVGILADKYKATFIDVGPTGTLANFVKYSQTCSRALSVMNQFGRDVESLEKSQNEMLQEVLV